jgi:hypothetical protein
MSSSTSVQAEARSKRLTTSHERERIDRVYCMGMRPSSSLGVVFIALGGIAVAPLGGRGAPGPVAIAIAALLVVAGVSLLTGRGFAFWVAMAAAAVAALTGLLAWTGHPTWGLPVPPLLSIGVGLYLILRTFMARASLGVKPRSFLPRDDEQHD